MKMKLTHKGLDAVNFWLEKEKSVLSPIKSMPDTWKKNLPSVHDIQIYDKIVRSHYTHTHTHTHIYIYIAFHIETIFMGFLTCVPRVYIN
jgi:hypothetical protein